MVRIFALSLLVLFFSRQHCFALEIAFQEQANVADTAVTLGDVVRFDASTDLTTALAGQVVAKSPQPGESISLQSATIREQILRNFKGTTEIKWVGATAVVVQRKGQQINSDLILQSIDTYLHQKKSTLPNAEIRFIAQSPPLPFMVPEGELTWEITPSSPAIIGSSSISIIIRVDDKVRKNIWLKGTVEAIAPVAVAATPLQRGSLITPANIRLEKKNLAEFNNPCLDLRDILGKKLKRSLRVGNVLLESDIELPLVIQKGQLVKILLRKGDLFLSATGIARMDGRLDQVIRVINTSSNKLVFCRVAAPGIVEVQI